MLRSWLARLAAAKVLAGALATTAVCGVALAATTGSLPGPLGPTGTPVQAAGRASATLTAHPVATRSDQDGDGRPGSAPGTGWPGDTSAHPSRSGPTARPSGDGAPAAIPLPAQRGLCRVWLVLPDRQRTRLVTLRPFAALVRTAGGQAKVDAFCVGLVGKPPVTPPPGSCVRLPHWPLPVGVRTPDVRGGLDEAPGWQTAGPNAWPSGWPSTWPPITYVPCPTGGPTGLPTGLPTGTPTVTRTHPVGPPITPPTRSWPFPTAKPGGTVPPVRG